MKVTLSLVYSSYKRKIMNKLVLFYVNISIDQQSTDNDTWKPVENDVVSVFVSISVKQVMRVQRVQTSIIIYNWLRSCLLDTDNLREVFYPKYFHLLGKYILMDLLPEKNASHCILQFRLQIFIVSMISMNRLYLHSNPPTLTLRRFDTYLLTIYA
ncbi:hypothetical protein KSF78_0008312 [Schistosoma japonicum]|nr:hypothetical protein KSF78_0008312 [Schistosoma japonicum]